MIRQDRQGTTPETADVVERCDQRSRINLAIGCDRLDRRLQEVRDGLHLKPTNRDPWLDYGNDHGSGGCADVYPG